jgi:hypothetical protein
MRRKKGGCNGMGKGLLIAGKMSGTKSEKTALNQCVFVFW